MPSQVAEQKKGIQQKALSDFSGGLNNKFNPLLIAENQAQALTNARLNTAHVIAKMSGHSLVGTPDIIPRVLKRFLAQNGTEYLLVSDGEFFQHSTDGITWTYTGYTDKTVAVTNGSATVTGVASADGVNVDFLTNVRTGDIFQVSGDTTTYRVLVVTSPTTLKLTTTYAGTTSASKSYTLRKRFGYPIIAASTPFQLPDIVITQGVNLPPRAYYSNGFDPVFSFDGTTTRTIAQFNRGRFIAEFQNVMFSANSSDGKTRLRYSVIGDPTTWPSDYFVDVFDQNDEGDEITGLVVYFNRLVIFKRRSIYEIIGTIFGADSTNYTLRKVVAPQNVGCFYPRTVAIYTRLNVDADNSSVFIGGNLQPILFLSYDGWYQYNGAFVKKISYAIDGTTASVIQNSPTFFNGLVETFGDSNYTYDPTWTPAGSSAFKVTVSNALQATTTTSTISMLSSVAFGTWQFKFRFNDLGGANNWIDISFIGLLVGTQISGYTLRLAVNHPASGVTNKIQLLDPTFSGIIDAAYVFDTNWHILKLTRSDAGVFSLFVDETSIGATPTSNLQQTSIYFNIGVNQSNSTNFEISDLIICTNVGSFDTGDAAGIFFNNAYRCAVRTTGYTSPSLEVRLDEEGRWLVSDARSNALGAYAVFNNLLYGSSSSSKQVFKLDTGFHYVDSGGSAIPINLLWKSKDMQPAGPDMRCRFYRAYITFTKETLGTLVFSYQIDGAETYSQMIDMTTGKSTESRRVEIYKVGTTINFSVVNEDLDVDVAIEAIVLEYMPFRKFGPVNTDSTSLIISVACGDSAHRPTAPSQTPSFYCNIETAQLEKWDGISWGIYA